MTMIYILLIISVLFNVIYTIKIITLDANNIGLKAQVKMRDDRIEELLKELDGQQNTQSE